MTEGRGPGPSHRPAVCSNSRFCSAPADPGARRQGARSSRVSGRDAASSPAATGTVAVAARGHSPFPSPPSRRAPGTARPRQPHTRSATWGPELLRQRAGAPEVTSAQAPRQAGTLLCRGGVVTGCSTRARRPIPR